MSSYEEEYGRMRTYWHGVNTPVAQQQSSPSHSYSAPSSHHSKLSHTVPLNQWVPPPYRERYAPPIQYDHYTPPAQGIQYPDNVPTPTNSSVSWVPYEPLKRKQDAMHHGAYCGHLPHGSASGEQGGGSSIHQPTQRAEPSAYSLPHLPGAAEYIQRREGQNANLPNTKPYPAVGPRDSVLQTHRKERTRSAQSGGAVARHSEQSRTHATLAAGSMNSQKSPHRNAQGAGALRGTQHAPLEILSSPEPDSKRQKTTKSPQATHTKQREAPRSPGPANYDGYSRQEITRMLVESSNARTTKSRYYAVAIGRKPGVYTDWSTVEELVKGFHGARHKKFKTVEEALDYVDQHRQHVQESPFVRPERDVYSPNGEPTIYDSRHFSGGYEPASFSPAVLQQSGSANPATETMPVNLDRDFVPLDDGPILVPEQQQVVDLIVQGHNVFYTGSAGCGKSTILKAFVKQLQDKGKRVKIVAPTNLAALNVGGQTTWNFAGWTPDSMKMRIDKLMENSLGKESWKKFDETDVLVIDEISMIENLQFERLNMIMKASRGQKYGGGAFGGVQLIVTGDFYQLAPVKPFHRCMCGWELEKDNKNNPKEYKCENRECRESTFQDIDKWAFRSNAWEECNFKHVNLTQIHRQSDMMFKSILNRIRTDGKILKPHANVLLNHTSETEGAIMLFARRFDVDRVNNENIAKIPSSAIMYKCSDFFDWPKNHKSDKSLEKNTYRLPDGSLSTLKEHRFDTQVQLKQDQRVVLQANIDPPSGLVNGAQGIIIEFKPYDENALPKAPEKKGEDGDLRGDHAAYRQAQIKQFAEANGKQPWPVVRFTNGVTRTIFADCTVNVLGNEEPFCKLSRTQVPLAAGYAITVHKSQGMTLDRVTVDLARAFEPSQIYVALSRARSLKGLTVTALPRFDLGGANAQVKEFMENIVMKKKAES